MTMHPVAFVFWASLSLALAFGLYDSIRAALAIHRSRFVPTRTAVVGSHGCVSIVMEGRWFSAARLEFSPASADETGRALIEMAAAMKARGRA